MKLKLLADRSGWLRATLLVLLLAVFLGAEIPEVHDHHADTPGLYNEECPLARLAVLTWGIPVVAADSIPARPGTRSRHAPDSRRAVRRTPGCLRGSGSPATF